MDNSGIPKEEIEIRAYELYLKCGCDGGHDLEHWLAAEDELREQRGRRREPAPMKSSTAAAGGRGTPRTER
jgi:hypothetical protein